MSIHRNAGISRVSCFAFGIPIRVTYARRVKEVEATILEPVQRSEAADVQLGVGKRYFMKSSFFQTAIADESISFRRIAREV